jgi:superoxide dismutase, Fe-Mn family
MSKEFAIIEKIGEGGTPSPVSQLRPITGLISNKEGEQVMKKGWMMCVVALALLCSMKGAAWSGDEKGAQESYKAKDYSKITGLEGFSENLRRNHFTLYQGYVKNTNLLISKLRTMVAEGQDASPDFAELKRRFGWEFNGMRLHEYYFENMSGGKPLSENSALGKMILRDFGSFDNWKKDFVATGKMRGVGWVVLFYDPVGNRLMNVWIEQHEANHLAGATPLLVMDVFEHAYMIDYELNRAKYIDVFFKNLNWDIVSARMK